MFLKMKWAWRAGSGYQQLVLTHSARTLSPVECSFGVVNDKLNTAYSSWDKKDLGTFPSTIEAKRNLLEHIKNQIANAHDDSKLQFEKPEQSA
jgi:predicted Rdx family selenoprotein